MNADRKTLLLVSLGVFAAIAAIVAGWQIRAAFEPRPVRAWIAIEVAGSGVAEIGVVEVPAGSECTLHAVLEAERLDGRPVYYTEAPGLRIEGREIPSGELRRWDRETAVTIFWFTVEGVAPRVVAGADFSPDDLAFKVSFRADWPRAWAVPAVLESSASSFAQGREQLDGGAFGTQRYHVRIEFYASSQALMPEQRFASWGAEALPARSADFPTLVASLPEPLAPVSRFCWRRSPACSDSPRWISTPTHRWLYDRRSLTGQDSGWHSPAVRPSEACSLPPASSHSRWPGRQLISPAAGRGMPPAWR